MFVEERKMKKIFGFYIDPLGLRKTEEDQLRFYVDIATGILAMSDGDKEELVTVKQAEEIIRSHGYEIYANGINWNLLENFDEKKQRFFDTVGKVRKYVEEIAELAKELGLCIQSTLKKDVCNISFSLDLVNGKINVDLPDEFIDPFGAAEIAVPKE